MRGTTFGGRIERSEAFLTGEQTAPYRFLKQS